MFPSPAQAQVRVAVPALVRVQAQVQVAVPAVLRVLTATGATIAVPVLWVQK